MMIMLRGGRKEDEMPGARRNEIYCVSRSDYTLLARVCRRYIDLQTHARTAARQLGRANSPAKRRMIYGGNIAGGKTREMRFY